MTKINKKAYYQGLIDRNPGSKINGFTTLDDLRELAKSNCIFCVNTHDMHDEMTKILLFVSEFFEIKISRITEKNRLREVVSARQIFYAMCDKYIVTSYNHKSKFYDVLFSITGQKRYNVNHSLQQVANVPELRKDFARACLKFENVKFNLL